MLYIHARTHAPQLPIYTEGFSIFYLLSWKVVTSWTDLTLKASLISVLPSLRIRRPKTCSAGSIVTTPLSGSWTNRGSLPGKGKRFFIFYKASRAVLGPSNYHSAATWSCFSWNKASVALNLPPESSAEVMKGQNYICPPLPSWRAEGQIYLYIYHPLNPSSFICILLFSPNTLPDTMPPLATCLDQSIFSRGKHHPYMTQAIRVYGS
jgi:hypothetical protein